jgi:hypothetical protein
VTVVWSALIVIGVVMIAVAVWPSIRRADGQKPPPDPAAPQRDDDE